MARRLVPAVLMAVLCVPLASAGSWLHWGGDASRTSATPDPMPDLETAFVVETPGAPGAQPIIVGRHAYLRTAESILDIDIDAATVRPIAPGTNYRALLSDGVRLFATEDTTVSAFDLAGRPLWTTPYPVLVEGTDRTTNCREPAAAQRLLVLLCGQTSYLEAPSFGRLPLQVDRRVFVTALDAETGEIRWVNEAKGVERDPTQAGSSSAAGANVAVGGLTLSGGRILALVSEVAPPSGMRLRLIAMDAATGEERWSRLGETNASNQDPQAPSADQIQAAPNFLGTVVPAAAGGFAYARLDGIEQLDLEGGDPGWRSSIVDSRIVPPRFALRGEKLFVAWSRSLRALDADTQTLEQIYELPPAAQWASVVATRDGVLAVSQVTTTEQCLRRCVNAPRGVEAELPSSLYAFDDSGHILWKQDFSTMAGAPSLSSANGLALVHVAGERLIVIGRTGASILPAFAAFDAYPPVGEETRVDLSATRPGVMADDLEFRADWGDGTVDEWQRDPVLTHTYTTSGEVEAVFSARNSAGQLSRETRAIFVGAPPPEEPNFVSRQFDNEHQNVTFFAFGIIGTGLVALVGLFRVQQRRGRLRRELDAIDRAFELTKARGGECERALAERRTHVRALLVDGNIDEPQHGFLERHIDALARQIRLASVDDELSFLSVKMARMLRGLLADGRIEAWEREQFYDALERDDRLSLSEKQRARAVVDEWSARDSPA